MNLEDLAIGWREALLGVVALLALYVLVVVVRLRRLKKAASPPAAAPVAEEATVDPVSVLAESPAGVPLQRVEPDFPWNEPPDAAPVAESAVDDGARQRLQAAEAELGQLRDEVATMRGELAVLRDDLAKQLERVQAAQHVAPIYGDAMQMATAGYDAAAIAERCGVARAEAELVVALIRNRDKGVENPDENRIETMRER